MSISSSLRISGSALTAQRLRMDVIAGNVANASTTRSSEGGPYKAREVVLREQPSASGVRVAFDRTGSGRGVQVAGIVTRSDVRVVNDPGHPDADENGNVTYPDIDVIDQLTTMMSAVRAYEASVTVANATKSMAMKSLELGRS